MTKNWLEWAVFAISSMIVVAMFAYLLGDAFTAGTAPPIIEVRLGEVQLAGGGYLVPVTILNSGAETAERVAIQVEIEGDGGSTESAMLELDYLPRRAERKGWVAFRADPRTARTVHAYARSFQAP